MLPGNTTFFSECQKCLYRHYGHVCEMKIFDTRHRYGLTTYMMYSETEFDNLSIQVF